MSEQAHSEQKRPWTTIAIAGAAVILLGIFLGIGGFLVGRATAPGPGEPETITEILEVEVTRIVEVATAANGEEASGESDESNAAGENDEGETSPETPTPLPTEVPTITPVPAPITNVDAIDFAIFNQVWDLVVDNFDGDMPPEKEILYEAIEGSLDALNDEYTRFVRPDIAARLREDASGSVSGIGAFVRETEDGFVEVVAPIEGQPADLAGILPGDLIVGVDGVSVVGMDFDEIILLVRGEAGTVVSLTIVRPGVAEEMEFSIVRARFEVPIVVSEMMGTVESPVAYVRLTEFNQNAEEKLLEALEELLKEEPVGLIFDLRNNPGGFLDQSIFVADAFLPEGVVLFERNKYGLDQTFSVDDGDIAEDVPLVVLVNRGSASASEIVAGAIQANDRGILVGETTFGKGSVQSVRRLPDGSELRVTVAHWFTPDNRSISDEGISPDIEVSLPVTAEFGGDEDIQLQRAIEYLLVGQ